MKSWNYLLSFSSRSRWPWRLRLHQTCPFVPKNEFLLRFLSTGGGLNRPDEYTVIITPDNATYVNSDLITWEALKLKNNPLLLILLKLQSEITIHNKTLTSLYIESAVNSINYTFPRDWIEYSVKTCKDWPKWAVLNNLAKSYNKTRSKSILMHFRRIHK